MTAAKKLKHDMVWQWVKDKKGKLVIACDFLSKD